MLGIASYSPCRAGNLKHTPLSPGALAGEEGEAELENESRAAA